MALFLCYWYWQILLQIRSLILVLLECQSTYQTFEFSDIQLLMKYFFFTFYIKNTVLVEVHLFP